MISSITGEVITNKVFSTRDSLGRTTLLGNRQSLLQGKFLNAKVTRAINILNSLWFVKIMIYSIHFRPSGEIDHSRKTPSSTAGEVVECKGNSDGLNSNLDMIYSVREL